jgi:hypothetical protein
MRRKGVRYWLMMLLALHLLDRALSSHAWLLSLKKPAARPMKNLTEYLQANRREMSQIDAEFIAEKHRADIVALSREEKELMSRFLERHFYWMFKHRVSLSLFLPAAIQHIRCK